MDFNRLLGNLNLKPSLLVLVLFVDVNEKQTIIERVNAKIKFTTLTK